MTPRTPSKSELERERHQPRRRRWPEQRAVDIATDRRWAEKLGVVKSTEALQAELQRPRYRITKFLNSDIAVEHSRPVRDLPDPLLGVPRGFTLNAAVLNEFSGSHFSYTVSHDEKVPVRSVRALTQILPQRECCSFLLSVLTISRPRPTQFDILSNTASETGVLKDLKSEESERKNSFATIHTARTPWILDGFVEMEAAAIEHLRAQVMPPLGQIGVITICSATLR